MALFLRAVGRLLNVKIGEDPKQRRPDIEAGVIGKACEPGQTVEISSLNLLHESVPETTGTTIFAGSLADR